MFVLVYSCQNATLLEITCHGSVIEKDSDQLLDPQSELPWPIPWISMESDLG